MNEVLLTLSEVTYNRVFCHVACMLFYTCLFDECLWNVVEKLSVPLQPVWWDRHWEQEAYSEVWAWDTLDGILEIFAADDECLK